MALTPEDKQYLDLLIQGVNAKSEFRSDILEEKIDGINTRLDKINGRVFKTEEKIDGAIQERSANREHQRSESERLDKRIDQVSSAISLFSVLKLVPDGKIIGTLKCIAKSIELRKKSFVSFLKSSLRFLVILCPGFTLGIASNTIISRFSGKLLLNA